jgi:hypothetical protein
LRAHRLPEVPRVDKSSLQVRCASTTSFRSPDQRNAGGAGGNAQATTCKSHSYTAPGEEHVILEVERFYEIEVNGVRCSIGWVQLLPGEQSTTSTATSSWRTDRRRRRARGGLRLAGSWAEIRRPPVNRARRKGGCSHHTRGYPVSIPHDIENRGVATGIDRELDPHVIGPIMPPPQLTEPTRLNLSRWRHGFEPRWDYE